MNEHSCACWIHSVFCVRLCSWIRETQAKYRLEMQLSSLRSQGCQTVHWGRWVTNSHTCTHKNTLIHLPNHIITDFSLSFFLDLGFGRFRKKRLFGQAGKVEFLCRFAVVGDADVCIKHRICVLLFLFLRVSS